MPTISGLRRRGYTPAAIKDFCERIGVAKSNSIVDIAMLEHCLREDLNRHAPRVMVVLRPLRVVIDNYPEGQVEMLSAENNPEDASAGTREVPFSRVLYIEQEDFMENPPKKFFRLSPGREVRLKHAYIVKCERVEKDENGQVVELHCTYDPETKSGMSQAGRKVKGTLHWVSAEEALPLEVRVYNHLFNKENPEDEESGDYKANLNPCSLEKLTSCLAEPSLKGAKSGSTYQFLRQGYFTVDPDSTFENLVVNRSVPLKDTWAKVKK
jgi:glutaminyl-tRNA synthetase